MKLFIYYSLSGNGDTVANYLKEKHIEIRKVIPQKELPKNMVARILTGGFLASINYKDKLKDFDNKLAKYEEVIIGSPIWNGRLSTPINAALDKIDLTDRRPVFILYSGSGSAPKADKMIKSKYPHATIIHLQEPKKNNKQLIDNLKKI